MSDGHKMDMLAIDLCTKMGVVDRHICEEVKGNAHNVNCNIDLVILAIREESEQQQTKLSEHVKTLQEAVKAEVHTINCNFDLVLHALRDSLEKQQQKVQWQKRMINTLLFVLWTVLCAVLSFVAGIGCAVAMKQGEIDPDNEHVIKVWNFVYTVLIPARDFMRSCMNTDESCKWY